jgi:hypothetical protein
MVYNYFAPRPGTSVSRFPQNPKTRQVNPAQLTYGILHLNTLCPSAGQLGLVMPNGIWGLALRNTSMVICHWTRRREAMHRQGIKKAPSRHSTLNQRRSI